MEVCIRPFLDYKSHFAAASLRARSTELRGRRNLLFKARPDKDSYQVSLKGTFIWKSSVATFHLFAVTAEQRWEPEEAGIAFPPQTSFSWFPRVFSSPCSWDTTGCSVLIVVGANCLFATLLCRETKSQLQNTYVQLRNLEKDVLQQTEVILWNLTGWPLFSEQKTKIADWDIPVRRAAKRKLLSKILNALSF